MKTLIEHIETTIVTVGNLLPTSAAQTKLLINNHEITLVHAAKRISAYAMLQHVECNLRERGFLTENMLLHVAILTAATVKDVISFGKHKPVLLVNNTPITIINNSALDYQLVNTLTKDNTQEIRH